MLNKKIFNIYKIIVFLFVVFLITIGLCACSHGTSGNSKADVDNFENVNKPVIGIAWVPNRNEAFYQNWEYIIQKAGGIPVNLEQVISNDVKYDKHKLVENSELGAEGMLNQSAADRVKGITYKDSNVEYVLDGIDGVFVPGGEDISPTLIQDFDVAKNTCTGFSASRDVSDYLLESYCIDKDIPMFCVCRGMQMLSVVCRAHMIQDIPEYCEENNLELNMAHKDTKDWGPKDFVRHGVKVIDKNSVFYQIVKSDNFDNVPSWHHQAVHDVSGTNLREVAIDSSGSFKVIEAIELVGKSFILGTQFHPEVVVNRVYKMEESDPCDVTTCLRFFQTLVKYSAQKANKIYDGS